MRYKEILENKAKLAGAIHAMRDKIAAENRDFSAEENEQWNKLNADYDANERRLEVERRASSVSGSSPAVAVPRIVLSGLEGASAADVARSHRMAIAGWLGASSSRFRMTDEHREAAATCGIDLASRELPLEMISTADYRDFVDRFNSAHIHERRRVSVGAATNMSVGTNSAGGYTVPPGELLSRLERAKLWFGVMAQVAETMLTATGEPVLWPGANDTGNTGELLSEAGSMTGTSTSNSPTITQTSLGAYKFSSIPVRVSSELFQDSIFNLAVLLGDMLGERLGRVQNTYMTTGTGTSQPQGIVTGATLGTTASSTTAFTADDIISFYHSVDIAYRVGAQWMFNDAVIAFIRKLKDGQGRYLWQDGLRDGRPDQILGCTVNPNNDMSSTFTTGQKLGIFGQLSNYKIRRAGPVRIVRLNELYADTDQVGFNAYERVDGRVLDAGTHPIKYMKLA